MVRRDNMSMACGVNGIHNPIKKSKLLSICNYWLDFSSFAIIFKGFFILLPEDKRVNYTDLFHKKPKVFKVVWHNISLFKLRYLGDTSKKQIFV